MNSKYYIFGENGGKEFAEKNNVELLGQIPIVQSIREGGDNGTPAALDETSPMGKAYGELAQKVAQQVAIRNANLEPTKIVEITKLMEIILICKELEQLE